MSVRHKKPRGVVSLPTAAFSNVLGLHDKMHRVAIGSVMLKDGLLPRSRRRYGEGIVFLMLGLPLVSPDSIHACQFVTDIVRMGID